MERNRIHFLGRFGDSDQQDLVAYIEQLWAEAEVLQLQIAELEHSQMKRENNLLRKSITDINRNYTEVVNENLELRRQLGDGINYGDMPT